jgi:hypothetical protein
MKFDDRMAAQVETTYRKLDVVQQRLRVLEAIELKRGENLLDIGSGPGLAGEAAAILGPEGCSRRRPSESRPRPPPRSTFQAAHARELPLDNESFDAAIATQVYDYASDIRAGVEDEDYRPTPVDLHRGRRGTSLRSAVVSCASCCRGQRVSRTAPAPLDHLKARRQLELTPARTQK